MTSWRGRELHPHHFQLPDRLATVEAGAKAAAGRLGRTVVAIYRDEGISGTRGRDKRPGLDALLKGVARRGFDIVAAWSVCRLGRSLSDLIGLLGELQAWNIDLYLHQQALDTSTPSGRMLFGMLGVFSEFERTMRPMPILAVWVIPIPPWCAAQSRSILTGASTHR
jgi:DNA invertase Pin-like site-specific DNA recombinase